MIFDPANRSPRENYGLLISALVPRPIAFVSTLGANGVANCAPFSFFMGVSSHPPTIAVSVGSRRFRKKDTARNVLDHTGDFVVNIVTEEIADKMVVASGDWAEDVSEFDEAGLTPAPSDVVKAPRIAESPINMECQLVHHLELGAGPNHLLIGEVVRIHVRDDLLVDGIVDIERLRPVGRLGGAQYCRVRDVFEMDRPLVTGAKSAFAPRDG
jgi:flavin reductase (DIM6/NTAB) family NADH-FMN oxidoreductase RutF